MPEDSEHLVRDAVEAFDEAFAVYRAERDGSGSVVGLYLELINGVGGRWLAASPPELLGRELAEFAPQSLDTGLWDLIATGAGGAGRHRERIRVRQGHAVGTLEVYTASFGADHVLVACRDITDQVAAEDMLASGRATLQTALDATSDAFAVFDVARGDDGELGSLCLRLVNAAGAASCGVAPDLLIGCGLPDLFTRGQAAQLPGPIGRALAEQMPVTVRVHEHDDSGTWVAATGVTIAPVGRHRVVLTWRDVTADERRERDLARAHDRAWYAATHDPLTGLANRALLVEQMREVLWSADHDNRAAVVYVDLDCFKPVNDTLGHAAGDDLLRAVAARLAGVIRTGDLAARVGGDEFVLLLRNVRQEWDTDRFLQRVRLAVEQPVLLGESAITPRASFGIVLSPPASKDIDGLMRKADSLMYQDKLSRRRSLTDA